MFQCIWANGCQAGRVVDASVFFVSYVAVVVVIGCLYMYLLCGAYVLFCVVVAPWG